MNEQEIFEGNRLIAEFMGATVSERFRDELTFQYTKDNSPTPHTCFNWTVGQMQYHTSWDWLMPVVEKIEFGIYQKRGLDEYNVSLELCACVITRYEDGIKQDEPKIEWLDMGDKIDAAYCAILEFIQWYNTQSLPIPQ